MLFFAGIIVARKNVAWTNVTNALFISQRCFHKPSNEMTKVRLEMAFTVLSMVGEGGTVGQNQYLNSMNL